MKQDRNQDRKQTEPIKAAKQFLACSGNLADQAAWHFLEEKEENQEQKTTAKAAKITKVAKTSKVVKTTKTAEIYYSMISTPIAERQFWVAEQDGRILGANFYRPAKEEENQTLLLEEIRRTVGSICSDTEIIEKDTPVLKEARKQLSEYFAGVRKEFRLPLVLYGTAFQLKDWQALCTIPYGETKTYGELAAQIGRPKASRAVGMANHNNPISLIVPCHRVIGAGGKLVGYGGGLDVKEALLNFEKQS